MNKSNTVPMVPPNCDLLRDYIDQRFDELDRRYQLRYELTERASELSAKNNNTRLEAMNEFRATLADQAARLPTRIEVENMTSAARAEAKSDLGPVIAKIDALGQPNLTLMTAFAAVLFSIVSAGWVIIGLKIDSTNQPLALASEAAKADSAQLNERMRAAEASSVSSSQADSTSRSDRAQLNSRLLSAETIIASNTTEQRTQSALTSAKLVEVESQFKAMSDILNMTTDNDQRLFGILYAKAFPGSNLPNVNYRPQMYRNN